LPAAVVADTIVRTVELGVTITDAAVDGEATVVFCTLLDDGVGRRCPGCGAEGVYRDTVIRRVTDVPVVGHPLRLQVRVPRYRCMAAECDREVFAHNTDRLARRGWSTTRRCARYICRRLMIDRATIAAVARERRRRPHPGDKWHLDEVFIRINGKMHYLWRAVDQHGNVLDILVQPRRDAKAAKKFFRRLLKG
jgi:hypothetical protein